MEKSQKEGKEKDDAPYIISNPSNFEINEKDFEVIDKEDKQLDIKLRKANSKFRVGFLI